MYEILEEQAIIRITGADSVKFLQSLITNDVVKNYYCYSFLLNNQGRYLFDFFVYKASESELFIEIHKSQCDLFIKKISLYKLRSDVVITNVSEKFVLIYSPEPLVGTNIVSSCRDPRYQKLGFRSIIARSSLLNLDLPSSQKLYIEDKYRYTIIDGVTDMVYEKSIPVEYGADDLNAISYSKGCYIGQETISRIKYQGVVRKRIFQLVLESIDPGVVVVDNSLYDNIAKGDFIYDSLDQQIGIVCSAYGARVIALLKDQDGDDAKLVVQKLQIAGNYFKILAPDWR